MGSQPPVAANHPLVALVIKSLQAQGKGRQAEHVLDAPSADKVGAALKAYFGRPELVQAIDELLSFAAHLQQHGSLQAAKCLVDLTSTALPALEALKTTSSADAAVRVSKETKRAATAFKKLVGSSGGPRGSGLPDF